MEPTGPRTTLHVYCLDGNAIPVRALLDTGSARNLIRKGAVKDLQHPINSLEDYERVPLMDASGNFIHPLGKITARWYKHGGTRETTFYVVSDDLEIDLILGCTFLEREGIVRFYHRLLYVQPPVLSKKG
ncbi:MAG: hypothetical protein MMC33_007611 [Icmadophila ericetorum]|nr:hypothetical protein [Icmadophila ericetorum]